PPSEAEAHRCRFRESPIRGCNVVETLKKASEGLLFQSETDAPFEPRACGRQSLRHEGRQRRVGPQQKVGCPHWWAAYTQLINTNKPNPHSERSPPSVLAELLRLFEHDPM